MLILVTHNTYAKSFINFPPRNIVFSPSFFIEGKSKAIPFDNHCTYQIKTGYGMIIISVFSSTKNTITKISIGLNKLQQNNLQGVTAQSVPSVNITTLSY